MPLRRLASFERMANGNVGGSLIHARVNGDFGSTFKPLMKNVEIKKAGKCVSLIFSIGIRPRVSCGLV